MTALLVPALLTAAALYGALRDVDVYAALCAGARDGLRVLRDILPPLVVLLTAVAMLRASGALDALARALSPVLGVLGIPPECAPLMFLRPFSGSGALALGGELMRQYGPDSAVGRTAAVMLGSTETTFYVIGVYFGAAGVRKTRYAIPAAIVADLTGFFMAAAAAATKPTRSAMSAAGMAWRVRLTPAAPK